MQTELHLHSLLRHMTKKNQGGDTRVVMHLSGACTNKGRRSSAFKETGLAEGATAVYEQLSKKFNREYDNAGSIGKAMKTRLGNRYTVFITYDFDSAEDNLA